MAQIETNSLILIKTAIFRQSVHGAAMSAEKRKVVIADEDTAFAADLQSKLEHWNYEVGLCNSISELEDELAKKPAALLIDFAFGRETSAHPLDDLMHKFPSVPVIMFADSGSISIAVHAIKTGAYDFLSKPVDSGRLRMALSDAIATERAELLERRNYKPTQKHTILLADDDVAILKATEYRLKKWGYQVVCARNNLELNQELAKQTPAVILLDVQFGKVDGMEVLQKLLTSHSTMPVIMFTGFGSIDNAVNATKLGAYDYLTKPVDPERMREVIADAVNYHQTLKSEATISPAAEGKINPRNMSSTTLERNILGQSRALENMRDMISSVAATDATVLILGESGTGKELVARQLHTQSQRSGPFVPVNMAALPKELVESTLFGHEKGAFTGADKQQIGCCEAADKGTLFLDEIGEMDMNLQAKLLRFLQERSVHPVGSTKNKRVDVRVVAATNRNLLDRVEEGLFREDLYYRLNVIPIAVPCLRERLDDIPLLAQSFLEKASKRFKKENLQGFSNDAIRAMQRYSWPGNIRELENIVDRLVILSPRDTQRIDVEALPKEISHQAIDSARERSNKTEAKVETNPHAAGAVQSMETLEKEAIIAALRQTKGKVREAAEILKLGQATVYRKIKSYGIVLEDLGRMPS